MSRPWQLFKEECGFLGEDTRGGGCVFMDEAGRLSCQRRGRRRSPNPFFSTRRGARGHGGSSPACGKKGMPGLDESDGERFGAVAVGNCKPPCAGGASAAQGGTLRLAFFPKRRSIMEPCLSFRYGAGKIREFHAGTDIVQKLAEKPISASTATGRGTFRFTTMSCTQGCSNRGTLGLGEATWTAGGLRGNGRHVLPRAAGPPGAGVFAQHAVLAHGERRTRCSICRVAPGRSWWPARITTPILRFSGPCSDRPCSTAAAAGKTWSRRGRKVSTKRSGTRWK